MLGRSTPPLLSTAPGDVDGYSNHVINVVNSENKVTRSLIMIDSHAYAKGHIPVINWAYDNVHDNQIEWYSQVVKNLADENGAAVPSSVFLHIPLTEYRDAWNEYVENGRKDTENVKFIYGIAGEDGELVYCGSAEDGLFEAMLDGGSTDTVFCGHDHGGIWQIPFVGGVYAPEQGFFPEYDKGEYDFGRMKMFLSAGLEGYYIVPRLFNRPEILSVTVEN